MLFFHIRNQWSITLGLLIIGCALSAGAHVGNRVFPIAELTDEMLAEIQLDGSVDEWFDLIDEPTLTRLDFVAELEEEDSQDPSDIDFRIWLAWHDEPARLYVAFVASDDFYQNTHDYDVDWLTSFRDDMIFSVPNDGIVLGIDGDHSGGPGRDDTGAIPLEVTGETQVYEAISRTPGSGPIMDDLPTRQWGGVFSWMTLPPYGEAAGSVASEAPIIWVIELYITPFDHRGEVWASPEGSVVSDLTAGQIIGFAIGVFDVDDRELLSSEQLAPEVQVMDSDREVFWDIQSYSADYFLDGLLLSADSADLEDSAIEAVSWGRIKASLEME